MCRMRPFDGGIEVLGEIESTCLYLLVSVTRFEISLGSEMLARRTIWVLNLSRNRKEGEKSAGSNKPKMLIGVAAPGAGIISRQALIRGHGKSTCLVQQGARTGR